MHRPAQDPYGGLSPYIDKLIGNSYETVKYVARYLKEIRYVAYNMSHIYNVSVKVVDNLLLSAEVTSLGSNHEIPLPVGITQAKIQGSTVSIVDTVGNIYGPGESLFSWIISNEKLIVSVSANAPPSFVGGKINWLINWQSQPVAGSI
jgi:hypothetical protein